MQRIFDSLLDLIYPRTCYGCECSLAEGSNRYLCLSCWRTLPLVLGRICLACGMPLGEGVLNQPVCNACNTSSFHFDQVRAAGEYRALLRDLILKFKFHRDIALSYPLAAIVLRHLTRYPLPVLPSIIIPVPLSHKARRTRGYNQAGLIASLLSRQLQIVYYPHALSKIRDTEPQSSLNREERLHNLKGGFKVVKSYLSKLSGKTILLIDDIFTTGATVNECAHALKQAGAHRVYVAVVCRTTERSN